MFVGARGLACAADPALDSDKAPLTIDVHANVFNGSDLQLKRFLELVVTRQSAALAKRAVLLCNILQDLAWELAPTAGDENPIVQDLIATNASCPDQVHEAKAARLRQEGYARARTQLLQSALSNRRPGQLMPADTPEALLQREATVPMGTARADFVIRHLYGSDWEMRLPEANLERYLSNFETLFAGLQRELLPLDASWSSLTDNFFWPKCSGVSWFAEGAAKSCSP
jgi:hypothetical protein